MELNKIDRQDIDLNQPNDEKNINVYTSLIWVQNQAIVSRNL
mgnify:CR=1 FL=1